MRKLIVPDIHGRMGIVNKTIDAMKLQKFDKVIFQGDYWDSFDVPFEEQLKVFKRIIKLKNDNPETVILLWGNHDIHYLTNLICYGGFQYNHSAAIRLLMEENFDKFVNCYLCKETKQLHLHAGLSSSFKDKLEKIKSKPDDISIDEWLNSFTIDQAHILYHKDGYTPHNNISMIRPEALLTDIYLDEEFTTQVVGHTGSNRIRIYPNLWIVDSSHCLEVNS